MGKIGDGGCKSANFAAKDKIKLSGSSLALLHLSYQNVLMQDLTPVVPRWPVDPGGHKGAEPCGNSQIPANYPALFGLAKNARNHFVMRVLPGDRRR